MQAFDVVENTSKQQRRFDIRVFNEDTWLKVGTLYTDSPWLIEWVKLCLLEKPPVIGIKTDEQS